jgi:outer membrane receptor protein involved in Fe transport
MFHPYGKSAWFLATAPFLLLCIVLARFIRSGGTGVRVGRLVCLSAGVGCLLASVTASAQEPSGQNIGPDQGIVTLPAVTVQEKALDNARAQISPNLGATTYTLDSDKIDSQSQGEFASFDQTFYRFPGVAQDELDKRLHVRGEEANLQYRINGLLLPDGLSGFGQELSSKFLDSVSLITGTLPAQYGNRTAGIVDIQTKTGQDLTGGTISVYGGDYQTAMPTVEYGGSSGSFSGYGNVGYLHNSIGMANPTSSFRPSHDDTNQFKGFGNFSYLIDNTSRLTLILSAAYGTFQLPTRGGLAPQFQYGSITTFDSTKVNENQYEQAYYEILGYQKSLGNIDLQLTQSTRYSDISFKPDTVGDVIFNGIATKTDHQLISNNLQCDVSDRINDRHTLRGGLSFNVQQAKVNTADTVLPATWNGVDQWVATPGGQPSPIIDNYHKAAELYGVYLQDEWRPTTELTINYGLRADVWSAFITESQISPRINVVYKPVQPTTLHAGYGRYFTPPPLELIQAGDTAKFINTTNGVDPALQSTSAIAVKSERYHYFDVGVNQDITANLHAGVDAYYKIKKNVLDEGQFGPAMIFSPNNAVNGRVYGVEVTVSYEKDGLAVWGNAARSQAMAKGLAAGQWQFSADEVAYMQTHWYHLDHDQDWTASAGASYKWDNTKVYADTLYGSGLYGGTNNAIEMPNYTTLNLGATHDFKLSPGNNIKVRFDVTNVTDLKYEIRDGNGIGVFAPQYLPRRAFYAGISKNF